MALTATGEGQPTWRRRERGARVHHRVLPSRQPALCAHTRRPQGFSLLRRDLRHLRAPLERV